MRRKPIYFSIEILDETVIPEITFSSLKIRDEENKIYKYDIDRITMRHLRILNKLNDLGKVRILP